MGVRWGLRGEMERGTRRKINSCLLSDVIQFVSYVLQCGNGDDTDAMLSRDEQQHFSVPVFI